MGAIKQQWLDCVARFHSGDKNARNELVELGDPLGLTGLSPTLDAVANYYERGFSVVPQRPGAKSPCVQWKPYQVEQPTVADCYGWWYDEWADAGVAIILGPVSGLFVIDVDGEPAHDELIHRHGRIPRAPMVLSGSGKPFRYHLFFGHPIFRTKARATPWHAQLEFRGHGGIVVSPPSLGKSGNRYRFVEGLSLEDIPLPPVPDAVLEALKKEATRRSQRPAGFQAGRVKVPRSHNLSRNTREFLEGRFAAGPDWNARLFKAACDMAGNGYSMEAAEPLLIAGAQPWNPPEHGSATSTIRSAFTEPRQPAKPQTCGVRPKMHPAIAIEFQRAIGDKKKRGSKYHG